MSLKDDDKTGAPAEQKGCELISNISVQHAPDFDATSGPDFFALTLGSQSD